MIKKQIKTWLYAFRLRTLPLATSGIIAGNFLAYSEHKFRISVFFLSLLCANLLQILSNLANDYGDGTKGTDNNTRIGPIRSIQSGKISKNHMKMAINVFVLLCLISGFFLLYFSFNKLFSLNFMIFICIGIIAVASSIFYTVGKKAYGYKGFGDLFVFIFFGLVSVYGSYYLQTHTLSFFALFPAVSIGLFSAGVLNINNMRDRVSDIKANKKTIPVRIGEKKALVYHNVLIISGIISSIIFSILYHPSILHFFYFIIFLPFIIQLFNINKIKQAEGYDPFLKKLSLSTLIFSLFLGISLII